MGLVSTVNPLASSSLPNHHNEADCPIPRNVSWAESRQTSITAGIQTGSSRAEELELIRQGNPSASLAFGGVVVGLAIPLGSCLDHAFGLTDCPTADSRR